MFEDNSKLLQWLEVHAEPPLLQKLGQLKEEEVSEIRKIYEEFGDLKGSSDLGVATGLLGKAIARFVHLAKDAESLVGRQEEDPFVKDLVFAHFRLLDRGIAGDGHYFMHDFAEHLPQAFPNGPENDLVGPLADQAIEACHDALERMKNP